MEETTTKKGITVLSLFDGMSCGRIALREAGIKVNKYFASEIDKHAIKQTQHNFPDTVQLGSVTGVRAADLPHIDLLIGGSPCQGFSFAGKQLNFNDPRSALFFEYVRILREIQEYNPGVLFLLENVRMRRECEQVITEQLGLEPVVINSALVSAQNRVRLYWTNIRTREEATLFDTKVFTDIPQPEDRGIYLRDILEDDVEPKYVLTSNRIKKLIEHHRRQAEAGPGFGFHPRAEDEKSNTLRVGGSCHDDIVLLEGERAARCVAVREKTPTVTSSRYDANNVVVTREVVQLNSDTESNGRQPYQQDRVYSVDGISPALCSAHAGHAPAVLTPKTVLRRLTPTECSRLQTVPDWYEWKCSKTQIYRMLGNGWTVEVIKHIFSFINTENL